MCDPIKSIANRLRGLREVLELSAQEVAESCHLRVEEYMALESGESDISVNVLQTIARRTESVWTCSCSAKSQR